MVDGTTRGFELSLLLRTFSDTDTDTDPDTDSPTPDADPELELEPGVPDPDPDPDPELDPELDPKLSGTTEPGTGACVVVRGEDGACRVLEGGRTNGAELILTALPQLNIILYPSKS